MYGLQPRSDRKAVVDVCNGWQLDLYGAYGSDCDQAVGIVHCVSGRTHAHISPKALRRLPNLTSSAFRHFPEKL